MSNPTPESPIRSHFALLGAILPGVYLLLTSTRYTLSGMWPYDAKRILQFVLLFLILLLPLLSPSIRSQFSSLVRTTPSWLKLGLIFIAMLGSASAISNSESALHLANLFSEVALMTSLVFCIYVIAACRKASDHRFDQITLWLIALTLIVVGLQELLGVAIAKSNNLDFNYDVALPYFSKPRFFNQVQSWVILVIPALFFISAKTTLAKLAGVISLALTWYVLIMTTGRGAILGVFTGLLFTLVLIPQVRKLQLISQLSGLFLGALIFLAVSATLEGNDQDLSCLTSSNSTASEMKDKTRTGNSAFLENSLCRPVLHTSGRSKIWAKSLAQASANPVLGIGPMNFACKDIVLEAHPHSFPIKVAVEWGFLVFLATLGIVIALVVRATAVISKNWKAPSSGYGALLFSGIVSALVYSLFSGVMTMPASQVTGILVLGSFLGLMSSDREPEFKSTKNTRVLLVVGFCFSIYLLIYGIHELVHMDRLSDQLDPHLISPRTWQDAKVCGLYLQ